MLIHASSHLGQRSTQEDRYDGRSCGEFNGIAVFDGHGGSAVSEYLSFFFYGTVERQLKKQESTVEDALKKTVREMDEKMLKMHGGTGQGSTLCSVIVREKMIISTNVGDSRAVLGRKEGTAVDLTRDHTPYDPIEKARIEAAGLTTQKIGDFDKDGKPVPGKGCVRINHGITLARTIGYSSDRPGITPEPEIKKFTLSDEDEFVVAACDGIWDFMSSKDVISFVFKKRDDENAERKDIPQLVIDEALSRGAFDNLTVVIMWIKGGSDEDASKGSDNKEPHPNKKQKTHDLTAK